VTQNERRSSRRRQRRADDFDSTVGTAHRSAILHGIVGKILGGDQPTAVPHEVSNLLRHPAAVEFIGSCGIRSNVRASLGLLFEKVCPGATHAIV